MKSSVTWALLGALSAGVFACGPGSSTADTGSGGDAGTETGAETGSSECTSDMPMSVDERPTPGGCVGFTQCKTDGMGFCPAQITNSADRPQFAITQIDVATPMSLRGAVGNLLNSAIGAGNFLWGIDVNVTGNMVRTGAVQQGFMRVPGQGFLQQTLQFVSGGAPTTMGGMANRWDPIMAGITVTGDAFETTSVPVITVPVYNEPDPMTGTQTLLTELPLRNAKFAQVNMRSMRNCIGLTRPGFSYNSCGSRQWQTGVTAAAGADPFGGRMEADISVDDARNIPLPSIGPGVTLCNIIAGVDCAMRPQSEWTTQPDRMVNGSTTNNAWHLVANFAAVGIRIQQ